MKRSYLALLLAGCAAVSGCSSATSTQESSLSGDETGAIPPSGGERGSTSPGGSTGGTGGGTTAGTPGADQQIAGKLTAGVWDDNLNFDFFNKYLAESKGMAGLSIVSDLDRKNAHDRALARGPKTQLDVAIVLDTTSSMSDEIRYLQAEFDAIAKTVKDRFPQTTPRFGLVVYRDHGDAYVTRSVQFTADAAAFRASLAAQASGGGGDLPEAVPEGLDEGVKLDWRTTGEVARVMFWVADAPQHPGTEQAVNQAVLGAVAKDIHVYPIASSGVTGAAELTMRTTAQVTGGRYIFLTDDSGVGNAHAEPHIPCYVVTPLQGAIIRMVDSEMRGVRSEPAAAEVIRTVGDPKDGRCELQDKSQVVLY